MDACYMNSSRVIRDLFSAFDEQPIEHQINLIEALGDFVNDWMKKHGLSSVKLPDKSWKTHMSMMVITQNHSCDVMSLFMHSKLFQKLIFMGTQQHSALENHALENEVSPEYGQSQDLDDDADSIAGRSSGTEAMEYEDIDRLLLSIDSASHVKGILDPLSSESRSGRSELDPPFYKMSEYDGEQNTLLLQSGKRKYKKRKLAKSSCETVETCEAVETTDENVKTKKRMIQIVDKDAQDEAEPELVDDNGVMKFKCGVCGALFTRIYHLRRHALLHYGVRPHACSLCPMTFARADHMRKHIARHMCDRKMRSCTACDMVFKTIREIREHVKSQHRPPPVVTSLDKTRTECDICCKTFANPKQLRTHVKRVHRADPKPFMCAECGQRFTRQGHLDRHMRLHTGDKPFMCNRCACQFARADHLRRHLQSHLIEESLANPPTDVTADIANVDCEVTAVNKVSSGLCETGVKLESVDCKPVVASLPFPITPLDGAIANHFWKGDPASPDEKPKTDSHQSSTSTVS